jgi:elongation of very long chain fatty acids protein 4
MEAFNQLVAATQNQLDHVSGGLKPHPFTAGAFGTSLEFMLAIDLGYLFIVLVGVQVMKAFSPVDLTGFKKIHNLFLFLLSLYMCLEAIRQAVLNEYSLFGNDMATKATAGSLGMSQIVWIFYLSKSYEFFDTFIMILTKKNKQISFLHVYHHSTIFAIWWCIAKYAPGGDAYFSVILNSFVHVVMYAYYFQSTIKYEGVFSMKPIKPYITSLQMFQFMCMLIQSFYDYMFPCNYPRFLVILLGGYMLTLLALFGNFFVQSYLKKGKKE